MGKFGFVNWDWKSSIDFSEVRSLKKQFGESVETSEVASDGSDGYTAAVHTADLNLSDYDWLKILYKIYDGDEALFKYEIPGQHETFELTQEQLKAIVKEK